MRASLWTNKHVCMCLYSDEFMHVHTTAQYVPGISAAPQYVAAMSPAPVMRLDPYDLRI